MSLIIKYISIINIVYLCACGVRGDNDNVRTGWNNDLNQAELNRNVEITGLLYHRFGEHKYPSTNISRELFREQLSFLKTNKYQVITLSEAIQKLLSVKEKGRFIVITVDDAFKSFLSNGYPILKEFGFRATLFVNTETIGSGDYLDWEELQYLIDQGIEIGNHTHSHSYFLNVDQTDRSQVFFKDVDIAQKLIKERLNIRPSVFSFPFGEYDIQMKNMIKDIGFIGAAAQNSGVISCYSDLYALPRFPMTDTYGKMNAFKEKISMKALPVIKTIPESTIAQQNPPVMEITLDKVDLDYSRLQCFIQGGGCKVTPIDGGNISFRITSTQPLTSRRHLYTITVPDRANKDWYWFSFQWVFPGIK